MFRFNCRCCAVTYTTPCNRHSLSNSVDHRSKTSHGKILQMLRTSVHFLVQHMFPRTYLQLHKFSLVSNSSLSLLTCACSVHSCKKPILSVPYDQLHTAHPHVHHTMYTMRIHCVDGCQCVQPQNLSHQTSACRSRYILQNFAQIGRTLWSSCAHATVTILLGQNRFLKHAHAHLDDNTSAKEKTKKKQKSEKTRKLTKTCRLLTVCVCGLVGAWFGVEGGGGGGFSKKQTGNTPHSDDMTSTLVNV